MEKLTRPPPLADRPLPHSMASKLAGWASLARQYPIFSKTWFAYRIRSFVVPLALFAFVLALIIAFSLAKGMAAQLAPALGVSWLVVAIAVTLGRALAVLVCQQGWSAPREAAGVVAALLAGVLVALALTPLTAAAPAARDAAVQASQSLENRIFNLALWFVVLAWLGGVPDLLAYFQQRRMLHEASLLEQVERYKDERNEVEMRLSVLASQVEPHFLFNTLAGVRAAMMSDPARGVVMIDHLIAYLRSTIPQLRADRAQALVALGSQLDSAQAYLGVIQTRLPRLQASVDCAPELRELSIPPLMLISLVENAVKHGIEMKRGPGIIRIGAMRVARDGVDMLELSVVDNGPGFGATASGSGIGLSNIRERLQHLYGGAASLSLRAGEEGGVIASLLLPIAASTEGAH